jgi:cystathionine gamma-synthase
MAPPDALSTRLVHADSEAAPHPRNAVVPPISVTTTFRRGRSGLPAPAGAPGDAHTHTLMDTHADTDAHFAYSRVEQPVRERVELVLGELEGGHALLYASGLAAAYAAIGFASPRRLLVGPGGYHGVQEIIKLYQQRTGLVCACVPMHNVQGAGERGGECVSE